MKCKHVQELLPLYVGRDLDEKRANLVTVHVQTCAECAGVTEAYRESRQLLQQFTPPQFSDAVYDGIRQRVLREIDSEPSAPGFSEMVAGLFRPRLRWVAATALVLAVSVFAFYFIANQRNANQGNEGQQVRSGYSPVAPSPSSTPNNGKPLEKTSRKTSTPTTATLNNTYQPRRRKSSAAAGGGTTSAAQKATPDTPSLTVNATPQTNNLSEPNAVPSGDSATSEKTLRVEMQTRD